MFIRLSCRVQAVVFLGMTSFGLCHSYANAQSATDPYKILTQADQNKSCDPQRGEGHSGASEACCGTPGREHCQHLNHLICTDPPQNKQHGDFCFLPDPVSERLSASIHTPRRGPNGTDFTFYVASDLHFWRETFWAYTQAYFPSKINAFAEFQHFWPSNQSGIPPNTFVKAPDVVVVPGDLTTGGDLYQLQAYRLLWEKGWLTGSIHFPVYPGLGNHDIQNGSGWGATDSAASKRMRDYLIARMGAEHMDLNPTGCLVGVSPGCSALGDTAGTANYSWDWEGVHLVMLNTWMADQDLAFSPPNGSSGALWLQNDLVNYVGQSGRPVILFQHFDLGHVAGNEHEWSLLGWEAFWRIIKNYNIVGIFAGHSHALQMERPGAYSDKIPSIDLPDATHPVSGYLDMFVDGSGGACDGNECTGGHADFMVAHVTDHYLDVGVVSWFPATDSAANFSAVGWVENRPWMPTPQYLPPASVCRKRLSSVPFVVIDSGFTLNLDPSSPKSLILTNNGTAALDGALALQFSETGARRWDFVDSCVGSSGNAYVLVSENSIQPGEKVTIAKPSNWSQGSATLVRLNDALNARPNYGPGLVSIGVATLSYRNVPIKATLTPSDGLTMTVGSNATPSMITIAYTGQSIPSNTVLTLTPDDFSMQPLQIPIGTGNSAVK